MSFGKLSPSRPMRVVSLRSSKRRCVVQVRPQTLSADTGQLDLMRIQTKIAVGHLVLDRPFDSVVVKADFFTTVATNQVVMMLLEPIRQFDCFVGQASNDSLGNKELQRSVDCHPVNDGGCQLFP